MSSTPSDRRPETAARPPKEWLLAREAARILGCTRHAVPGLARRGLITRRALPGGFPRYLRTDCEELARRSTTGAAALKSAGPGGAA